MASLSASTICEDLWLKNGPHVDCAEAGAQLVININASPYHAGKGARAPQPSIPPGPAQQHRPCLRELCRRRRRGDIRRTVHGWSPPTAGWSPGSGQFTEELLLPRLRPRERGRFGRRGEEPDEAVAEQGCRRGGCRNRSGRKPGLAPGSRPARRSSPTDCNRRWIRSAEVYGALVLGVRDYMAKNGFRAGADRDLRGASTPP